MRGGTPFMLGACDPDSGPEMALALVAALEVDLAGSGEWEPTGAAPVERDSPMWHALRESAPMSPVWAVLEEYPKAILIVAYVRSWRYSN